MSNITETNWTAGNSTGARYAVFMNSSAIGISLLTLLLDTITISVISKCRRLPRQIYYLSVSYIVSEMLKETVISSHSITISILGQDSPYFQVVFESRTMLTVVSVCISLASITSIILERLFALSFHIKYSQVITGRNIGVCIAVIWMLNFLLPVAIVLTFTLGQRCQWDVKHCDMFTALWPVKVFLTVTMVTYTFIVSAAYIRIHFIIKGLITRTSVPVDDPRGGGYGSERTPSGGLRATSPLISVVLAFMVLQSPALLHTIVFEIAPQLRLWKWRQNFQLFSYLGLTLNSFVNSYIYVWKLKECRMNFYLYLSPFNEACRVKAHELRLEVFDIVTVTKHRAPLP